MNSKHKEIRKLYTEGYSALEIKELLDISLADVGLALADVIADAYLSSVRVKWGTQERKKHVMNLYEKGVTREQIAFRVGVDVSYVSKIVT